MNKFLKIFLPILATYFVALYAFAAPVTTFVPNLLPISNQTYDLGSTTPANEWNNIYTKNLTVSGTCTGCSGSLTLSANGPISIVGSGSTFTFNASSSPFFGTLFATSTITFSSLTNGVLAVNSAGLVSASSTITVNNGGTGATTLSSGDILLGNGTGAIQSTSTLTVSKGGTGATSLSGILAGNGTGAFTAITVNSPLGFSANTLTCTTCLTAAITSLNGLSGATQTFTANGPLAIVSGGTVHNFNASSSPFFGTITASSTGHFNSLLTDTVSTFAGFVSTASSTVVGELHAGVLDIDNFATGDLLVQGDIYNYGGDHFLGTGTATTTLTVNAANILQITGGGLLAQASSTVVGLLTVSNLTLNTAGQLLIPNAADPTINTTGQLAINSTTASTSLRIYDGTAERVLNVVKDKSIVVASTTLAYIGAYGSTGTTTLLIANHNRPITVLNFFCKANGGTGAWAALGTGSATSTYINCTNAGTQAILTTNNTWTVRQNFYVEIGNQTGNPNYYTVTASVRDDAD